MFTIEVSDEQLTKAFEDAINKMLSAENYNNPVKSLIEKQVGTTYSKGSLTEQIEAKIITKLSAFMETTEFDAMLGQAIAKAIAEREVKKTK